MKVSVRKAADAGCCAVGACCRTSRILGLLFCGCLLAGAQEPLSEKPAATPPPAPGIQAAQSELPPVDLKSLPRNLFVDQKNFWSAPFHMSTADLQWAVPLAFAGAALVASDTAIEKHVPTDPSTVSHAVTTSNAGLAAFAALGGGMFVLGHFAHNDQERETGLLSGEAGIDAFLDTEVFAYAFGRTAPLPATAVGSFFREEILFLRITPPSVGRLLV